VDLIAYLQVGRLGHAATSLSFGLPGAVLGLLQARASMIAAEG
jgi:hypothetical protein